MQYRKKTVIDAEQFIIASKPWPSYIILQHGQPMVETWEGYRVVNDSDWIIRDEFNSYKVVNDAVFNRLYEQVQ